MLKQISTAIIFIIFLTTSLIGKESLNTENKKISYSFGYNFGEELVEKSNKLDTNIIISGIKDAFTNKRPLIDQYKMVKIISDFSYKESKEATALLTTDKINNLSKKQKQELSYTLGYRMGEEFIDSVKILNTNIIAIGLNDIFLDKKPRLTTTQRTKIMLDFNEDRKKEMIKKRDELKKANKDFLIHNKKKKGVRTLKSGLQYKIIDYGTGKISPIKTDTVTIHFHGKLVDGRVFDSSIYRAKALTLPMERLIPGFREILVKMRVGDKWQVFIPTELSRSLHAIAPKVPQNSTLIFDLELLKINK